MKVEQANLVAILTGALSSASNLGTVTRNVAGNTALRTGSLESMPWIMIRMGTTNLIASLGLSRTLMALRAVTAHVTFFIAVVASKDATGWTVAGLNIDYVSRPSQDASYCRRSRPLPSQCHT